MTASMTVLIFFGLLLIPLGLTEKDLRARLSGMRLQSQQLEAVGVPQV